MKKGNKWGAFNCTGEDFKDLNRFFVGCEGATTSVDRTGTKVSNLNGGVGVGVVEYAAKTASKEATNKE